MADPPKSTLKVRVYRPGDASACKRLYRDGLVDGRLASNDTGLDIDDIQSAYIRAPGGCFWVSEDAGQVVGMIGVQHHDSEAAEIRRLRVRRDHRRKGVGTALIEQALKFCVERQYLKVTLDTCVDRDLAIKLFDKFHYKLSRSRNVAERSLLYFYLDLYHGEPRPRRADGRPAAA
jgi:ribosomal protein S18 acetylase RimI-like enzyme